MSSVGIITGLIVAVTLGAGRLYSQSPVPPKTDKAVVSTGFGVDCQDSSQSHLKLIGNCSLDGLSAAWKNGHLFLSFVGQGPDAVNYRLEAIVASDLHFETLLSVTDQNGQRMSVYPIDHVLVLDHAPGDRPRALAGRISFRGIAEPGLPSPSAMQFVIVGDFCIRPE
jgi:hypothetical protein